MSQRKQMSQCRGAALVGRWRDRFDRFHNGDFTGNASGKMTGNMTGNMTVAEFCRQECVSTSNFHHWKKKLAIPSVGRRKAKAKAKANVAVNSTNAAARFVSVVVQGASTGARLLLPGGAVLELPGELEPRRLTELITAVVRATNGSDRNGSDRNGSDRNAVSNFSHRPTENA